MSRALVCDQCGEVLILDDDGEASHGEEASWVTVVGSGGCHTADLCTRACAIAWLEDPENIAAMDEHAEMVAEMVRQEQEQEARTHE